MDFDLEIPLKTDGEGPPGQFQGAYAVIEWNKAGQVVTWDAAAEKLFGFSLNEVYLNPEIALLILPEEEKETIERVCVNLEVIRNGFFSTNYNLTKDGQKIQCRWYNKPILDGHGKVTGSLSFVEDISSSQFAIQTNTNKNEVLSLLSNNRSLKEILTVLVQGVEQQILGAIGSVLLLDAHTDALSHGAAPNLPEFYIDAISGLVIGETVGSCGAACFSRENVIVADIQTHPNWTDYRALASSADLASCWSEPIINPAGVVLGSFAIYHRYPCVPSSLDCEVILEAAGLACIAIEKTRDHESLKITELVYQHTTQAIIVTDAQSIIVSVNPSFEKMMGYEASEAVGCNIDIIFSNRKNTAIYDQMRHGLLSGRSWSGEVWAHRQDKSQFLMSIAASVICSPDGSVFRTIAIISDLTQDRAAEDLAWRQANYDSLTALANRRFFLEDLKWTLKAAHRNDEGVALLLFDINKFSEVNDLYGHIEGDALLQKLAQRLRDNISEKQFAARVSGNEFAVCITGYAKTEEVDRIARTLLADVFQPYTVQGVSTLVSGCSGIALYPGDSADLTGLLACAERALFVAKASSSPNISYYQAEIQDRVLARADLLRDLRLALDQQQFELFYQPIVDMQSKAIHKAEALIRWHHPVRGWVSPDLFIPICEEEGFIVEVGERVFREAAQRIKEWRHRLRGSIQVSINVSPMQFQNSTLLSTAWLNHIAEQGLLNSDLALEITEGMILGNNKDVKQQLDGFRASGVELSLDDFGTGYSSLSYLKNFDMDYLKIDRSFVTQLTEESNERILCEAIIAMAHKLGLKVIAEGIETSAQETLLRSAGCDYGQGYWYAKPLPADKFEAVVDGSNSIFQSSAHSLESNESA